MSSKYVDRTALVQVVGCIYNSPQILDLTDKYIISENDFPDEMLKIIVGSIYKLHELGVQQMTLENINDFLANKPKSEAVYKKDKGEEWLLKASEVANHVTFDYYYNRMKKMSLLRAYDNYGIDVSWLYDPDNIFDSKLKQQQEDFLDNASLEDIAIKVDNKIDEIKMIYVREALDDAAQAGDGIEDLISRLEETPEIGVPLYGSLINTVTRGARLKKLYLRSAPTGVGKSRTMVADTCYIGCPQIYDENFGWIRTGASQPTLYITTEQEVEEIQTMMLAFLSNVDEDHILNGRYEGDEKQRILQAAQILKKSPVYIEELPDFSLQDIEDIFKKGIRDHDVKYVMFDYVHSSIKILSEISQRAGGVKLREDNILFMLAIRLKDLCNQYGVFIMTSTQLNGDWKEAKIPDQNLLRGAKSIGDKIDWGGILLPVTTEDIESLEPILTSGVFEKPTLKLSVYKNRRGRYKSLYLWCKANLGTCRVNPMFATTYDYELIQIDNTKVIIDDNEPSAF